MFRIIARVVVAVTAVAGAMVFVQAAPARTQLPSGSDIIARHIRALGGAEAYKKISTLRMTGRFEMKAQGIDGKILVLNGRPGKVVIRVDVSGLGVIQSGFDGEHGWSIEPLAGATLQTGRELMESKDQAWFDSTLYEPDFVKSFTPVGQVEFDGRQAYQVKVTLQSGSEQTDYFDVQDGQQIGTESSRQTPLGVVPTVSLLRDYKAFGALRQPTLLIQRLMGIEQVVTIESVEYDVVPASAFEPPAEVKALIKGAVR